jgi:hypothetical protein
MQGKMWAESQLGKGSCFYFTIKTKGGKKSQAITGETPAHSWRRTLTSTTGTTTTGVTKHRRKSSSTNNLALPQSSSNLPTGNNSLTNSVNPKKRSLTRSTNASTTTLLNNNNNNNNELSQSPNANVIQGIQSMKLHSRHATTSSNQLSISSHSNSSSNSVTTVTSPFIALRSHIGHSPLLHSITGLTNTSATAASSNASSNNDNMKTSPFTEIRRTNQSKLYENTVLMIDKHDSILNAWSHVMATWKIRLLTCHSVNEACTIAEEQRLRGIQISVLILSHHANDSEFDAIEAAQQLRAKLVKAIENDRILHQYQQQEASSKSTQESSTKDISIPEWPTSPKSRLATATPVVLLLLPSSTPPEGFNLPDGIASATMRRPVLFTQLRPVIDELIALNERQLNNDDNTSNGATTTNYELSFAEGDESDSISRLPSPRKLNDKFMNDVSHDSIKTLSNGVNCNKSFTILPDSPTQQLMADMHADGPMLLRRSSSANESKDIVASSAATAASSSESYHKI